MTRPMSHRNAAVRVRPRLTTGYLVRYAASLAAYYTGFLWLFRVGRRALSGARVRILAYHGFRDELPYIEMFMPPGLFRRQVIQLRRMGEVISLADYLAVREGGQQLTRDAYVVTMDDGYRDNFEVAMPLCRDLAMPMAVFVTTNCLEAGHPTFVAALILAIDQTDRLQIRLPRYGVPTLSLRSVGEKEDAIRTIDGLAKKMASEQRERLMEDVLDALGIVRRQSGIDELMLTRDQLRAMHAAGMEIGSHTRTHPVLSQIDDDQVCDEVGGSLRDLEVVLGARPVLFAYPYGGAADFDERAVRECARSGVRAAVTLVRQDPQVCETLLLGRDMLTVDRCATPWGEFSKALFACEVSGLFDQLRRNGGRR